jgi:hydroxyacylglutathione hydrolase
LLVRQIRVGPMSNFVYVVMDESSRDAMVVDSGWETGPIVESVREMEAKTKYVLATHGHFDHVSTLRELCDQVGGRLTAHERSSLDCDMKVKGGDRLRLGEEEVSVFFTPGHTDDSICIYAGGDVFTGDTLFVGTIGRFDRKDLRAMYESLNHVLLALPPQTMIYPGHDYGQVPCRTLAEEKESNPYLQPANFTGFASLFG